MVSSKRTSLIYPRQSPKMDKIYSALLEGWPNSSVNIQDPTTEDLFVVWGLIGNNAEYIKGSVNTFFVDMPYNGRYDPNNEDWDNTFWRFASNGLHDTRKLHAPGDRFETWNVELEEWKKDGEYILICPSSNTMTKFLTGMDQERWVNKVYEQAKRYSKLPVKVRFKPRKNGTSGPSVADVSIEDELKKAKALITLASLTAIDALKMGIPVFSDREECPSAWCTNRDFSELNEPKYYDREQLFFDLAYKQYSISEMRSGLCYENIIRYFDH